MTVLIFSVAPSTNFEIYSEKSIPCLKYSRAFFRLPIIAKRCAGTSLEISKKVETIGNLKRHIYRKLEQVASHNKHNDELKTREALIHVDYSESYSNTQQDEIQTANFGQLNFSVFTSCSYYREAKQGDLTKIPVVMISKSSHHSEIAAFTCTNAIINELKNGIRIHWKRSFFGVIDAHRNSALNTCLH